MLPFSAISGAFKLIKSDLISLPLIIFLTIIFASSGSGSILKVWRYVWKRSLNGWPALNSANAELEHIAITKPEKILKKPLLL